MGALKIQIERDGKVLREQEVQGELVIGRDSDCGIRLDDRAVSRKHAVLKAVQGGVELKRESAFAPMGHNGKDVTTATLLHAGDRLENAVEMEAA